MGEYSALLAGGLVLGLLFDAYAYYRFKYAERALDVAEGRARGERWREETEVGQKTLVESIDATEQASGESGGRKTLAQRLAEIDAARQARKASKTRAFSSEDAAVVFEPSGCSEVGESGGNDDSLSDSIAALRESIARLDAAARKRCWRAASAGGVAPLGDAFEGASFSENEN
ncbi:MAG: hypothetical protein QW343_01665 [Candidatus Norongarragalinales archaeon]